MRMIAQMGKYEMEQVTLYLGSNVNVLPEQSWEHMGRPALHWSLIQLRTAKEQNILLMGQL